MGYWSHIQDNLINRINLEDNPIKKNRLVEELMPELYIMAESILNRYYPLHNRSDHEMLISDSVTKVIMSLDKYDVTKRSYAFCGTTIRNYLFTEIVRTTKESEFNLNALKNNNSIIDDSEENYNFVTIDKNIENFDLVSPIELVDDKLCEMIDSRQKNVDKYSMTGYTRQQKRNMFGNYNMKSYKTELKYLLSMRKELRKMKDDFRYERWIINIIKNTSCTGENLNKIFIKLKFNNKNLMSITKSYEDRLSGGLVETKGDWIYDNQTPLERSYKPTNK